MTNIQAINLLKGLWQSLDDYCELNDEGKAAFCMAIEALSCSEIPNNCHLHGQNGRLESGYAILMVMNGIGIVLHAKSNGMKMICGWVEILSQTSALTVDAV